MKKRVLKKHVKRMLNDILVSSAMWALGEYSIEAITDIGEMKRIHSKYYHLLNMQELIIVSPQDHDTGNTIILRIFKTNKKYANLFGYGYTLSREEQDPIDKYITPRCDKWICVDLRGEDDGNSFMTDFCSILLRFQKKKSKGENR